MYTETARMPALFIGHGSPMNTLELNRWTSGWRALGARLPRPRALLVVSAHWYIGATAVTAMAKPRTIHDFRGFPPELFAFQYDAPGAPDLAREVAEIAKPVPVALDEGQWGLDHGIWSVLAHLFPDADVPVVQLSIDATKPGSHHLALAARLAPLRDSGVMILASGNVVHNLGLVDWSMDRGFDWADEFDNYIRDNILAGRHGNVVDYKSAGPAAKKAFFTPEHYYPLLYALGASDDKDQVSVWNNSCDLGAVSMTSYMFR